MPNKSAKVAGEARGGFRCATTFVAIHGAGDVVSSGLRAILTQEEDFEPLDCSTRPGITPDAVLYDAIGIEADQAADFCRVVAEGTCPVIVLGRDSRPDLTARAHAQGAFRCISLEADARDILATIRNAADAWAQNEGAWPETPDTLGAFAYLRPREIEALSGVAQGLNNAEICDLMGLRLDTVKTHLKTAYRKIGVTSRSQAMAWCLRHGFEPPYDDHAGIA